MKLTKIKGLKNQKNHSKLNHRNLFCKNSTYNKNGETPKPKQRGACDYYCRTKETLGNHESNCKYNKDSH